MKVLISLVLILALATLAGVVTITKAQTGEANNSSSAVLTPPDNYVCGNPVSQTF